MKEVEISDLVTNKMEVSLKGADFSSKVNLRDAIKDALFKKFSSRAYSQRLNRLRKTLKINDDNLRETDPERFRIIDDLTKVMRKHVTVRNCLEHADHKVRQRDISDAGHGDKIPMLNTDKTIHNFGEGDEISVSNEDIFELKNAILNYMKYFEVEL